MSVAQPAKFLFVGAGGYVVNLAVFAMLNAVGVQYLAASIGSYFVSNALMYLGNRYFTFGVGHGGFWSAYLRYLAVGAVVAGLNALILAFLVEVAGLSATIGQGISLLLVTPVAFLLNKRWTFRLNTAGADIQNAIASPSDRLGRPGGRVSRKADNRVTTQQSSHGGGELERRKSKRIDTTLHGDPRFVIYLGGLQSHNLETPGDHDLREEFDPIRQRLAAEDPSLRIVFFSYGAARRLHAGSDPQLAWEDANYAGGSEPQYGAVETTDRPLADHVAALDWLVGDLLSHHPGARLDLIGFSLGGIVALAWAAELPAQDVRLAAVHRIALISSPVGGITSLGRLTPAPVVRHVLALYDIGFGRSLVFRDLRASSPNIARLREVPSKVDVASIENSRDYVVNGRRITGQRLLPVWVRTITLGRGAAVTSFLPDAQCYVADLGGWDRHLRTTHRHILRGSSHAIDQARQHLIDLITGDGPIWNARQSRATLAPNNPGRRLVRPGHPTADVLPSLGAETRRDVGTIPT